MKILVVCSCTTIQFAISLTITIDKLDLAVPIIHFTANLISAWKKSQFILISCQNTDYLIQKRDLKIVLHTKSLLLQNQYRNKENEYHKKCF